MIELLWVENPGEVQNENTRRTLLWERWSGRRQNASPFGICVRPVGVQPEQPPFPAWEYRPSYLPDSLSMHIGEASVEEPMWVYLNFMRRLHWERHFIEHPVGVREITALTLTTRVPLRSEASKRIVESGILQPRTGEAPLLEVEFDGHRQKERFDFRPQLPLIFSV